MISYTVCLNNYEIGTEHRQCNFFTDYYDLTHHSTNKEDVVEFTNRMLNVIPEIDNVKYSKKAINDTNGHIDECIVLINIDIKTREDGTRYVDAADFRETQHED